ncbi:MAG: hypothetical protein QXF25_00695 [Candidatus Pacearchaeota archaeon]
MRICTRNPLVEITESIVSEIDLRVKRVQWTNEQIEQKFAQRSALEIIGDGDTFFMGPCLDFSLVAYEIMQREGIKPVLVVESLFQEGYQIPRLHFALEFWYAGELYFLDFNNTNKVILGKGNYRNLRDGIKSASITRIKSRLQPDKSLFENMFCEGIEEPDAQQLLAEYRGKYFGKQIEILKRANNSEAYSAYLANFRGNPALYLFAKLSAA